MLDRVEELSAQQLEAAVRHLVERKFEIARQRGAREVPIIGGEFTPARGQRSMPS